MGIKQNLSHKLHHGRDWLAGKYRQIPLEFAELRAKLAGKTDARTGGVNPENIIWIFGSGRSGSTWLRSIMNEMARHRVWEEPLVGRLFGEFYERAHESKLRSASFVMGGPIRKGWIRSIRNFVLDGARYVQPLLGPESYLVIKEPNGSVGAPLLMEALPESRMILLIRDPRDVVASALDATRKGNWLYGGERVVARRGGRCWTKTRIPSSGIGRASTCGTPAAPSAPTTPTKDVKCWSSTRTCARIL